MSLDRILAHASKEETGCWIWTGAMDKTSPMLRVSQPTRKIVSARRYAYEAHNQVCVPTDFVVTALCKNSKCVNPAHLAAVKRGKQGHRLIGDWKSEHCQHGHEFSIWNTSINRSGNRLCIACDKNRHKTNMARWRAENPEHLKLLRDQRIVSLYRWVDTLKVACILCGEPDTILLDFHHKDPSTKLTSISNAIRSQWSKEKILGEIEKCDVICVRCHRKHHAENNWLNRNNETQEKES